MSVDDTMKLSPDDLKKIYQAMNESASQGAGAGSFYGQYQSVLRGIDRFGYNPLPMNSELTGLTFITRPKLNLSTSSLRQDRTLASLDTTDGTSIAFMIRCLLDTAFGSREDMSGTAHSSPLLDQRNPFIPVLTNCIRGMSGWPDPVLDTETTDGGFHSEDLTFAKGSDRLSRSYDLTLTFREIQGGIILALLYIWIKFIDLVTKGNVVAYAEDIYEHRLCYTCSIYRFVLDPSTRVITKWAKATGCFPKSVPLGAAFNINEGEAIISSMASYSVPFQVNKIEYMDPIIFSDFNRLVGRACPDIKRKGSMVETEAIAEHNFKGIPYIDAEGGLNELKFYEYAANLVNPLEDTMSQITDKLKAAESKEAAAAKQESPDPVLTSV